ncbi:hypothetical protein BVRB_5g107430 [Beta vulgaris subsp. vulgaris]|nr:hypothetical protein BVRB_5g107430 [Beta vulgaris subsp. vulgaris]
MNKILHDGSLVLEMQTLVGTFLLGVPVMKPIYGCR